MIVKVKKIWMGHVSVRDYVLKKAVKQKEDVFVQFAGITKKFPHRSLQNYMDNSNKVEFKSMFNNETYYLIDLPWNPTSY